MTFNNHQSFSTNHAKSREVWKSNIGISPEEDMSRERCACVTGTGITRIRISVANALSRNGTWLFVLKEDEESIERIESICENICENILLYFFSTFFFFSVSKKFCSRLRPHRGLDGLAWRHVCCGSPNIHVTPMLGPCWPMLGPDGGHDPWVPRFFLLQTHCTYL